MGTKNNPGKFDCYENAEPDEPMFILLARDPLAPILVEQWAALREHMAGNPSKVAEARECAASMRRYRRRAHAVVDHGRTLADRYAREADEAHEAGCDDEIPAIPEHS